MTNKPAMIDFSRRDKEALLSMHKQAVGLYRHEKDSAVRNNAIFLFLSAAILCVTGILIVYTASCLEDSYIAYLNNEYVSSMELSAFISIVLLLITTIFFLIVLKRWDNTNKNAIEAIRDRHNDTALIERVLCEEGMIDASVCVALNDQRRAAEEQNEAENTEDQKKKKKKANKNKKKTNEEVMSSFIRLFRVLAILFVLVTIVLFAFFVYSFIGRLGY